MATDLSAVKSGDILARVHGSATPSDPVKVERRTPKFLIMEGGEKVRVDCGRSVTSCYRYEPWSDEREAERAARAHYVQIRRRFESLMGRPNYVTYNGSEHACVDDVLRNEEVFAEFEALLKRQEIERLEILARLMAGRPEKTAP